MIRVDPDYEWMAAGACVDVDPDLFFPERGNEAWKVNEARAVCARCSVAYECIDHARRHNERHGVWAGTTESERRHMRAGRRPWAPSLGEASDTREGGAVVVELRRSVSG